MQNKQMIIFFDGVCGLCNRFVDYVIAHDRQNHFLFSPLQGQTARQSGIALDSDPARATIVLKVGEQLFDKSTAALLILKELSSIYSVLKIFLILPRALRDPIYMFVSKNRYRWFGQKEFCRLPTPAEKAKFLP